MAGPGTTPLTFSGGKGVHVVPGQYLKLVTHINNTSSSEVDASTVIEGRVAAAKDVTIPIDMFLGGRLGFLIPANSSADINGGCEAIAESHLVAEITLMRAFGTHSVVTITDTGLDEDLFAASFAPQIVVYSTLTSDVDVPAGSHVNTTCSFVNTTANAVSNGESAHTELCFSGIYRYPPKPPTANSPVECALGQVI